MCGIAGYVSLKRQSPDRSTIEQMVRAMKHRGPDGQTAFIDGPVGLGHARLSIIDLATGQQPLFNEDNSISVICNGEIYNYRELMDRLRHAGHQFRTGSDCEVLAHLWEDHGPAMLDLLRGMFAFVLYDRRQGIVFGARDRFGQKPLYYYHSHQGFAFSSELKGLLVLPEVSRELDPLAIDQYLFHQFVPQPRTLFQQIKKLPAGYSFQLTVPSEANALDNGTLTLQRYWRPTLNPDTGISHAEHLARVEQSLVDAVRSHMVADVSVGVFLSGGIDSSLITALAARSSPERLKSFSISFPGSVHDEGAYARSVSAAFGTDHHEFAFKPNNVQQTLAEAAVIFDQPVADTAVLPLMMLSRAAAEHIKVVLTGDGGDELFAGYRKYQRMVKSPGNSRWLSQLGAGLFPVHRLAACSPDALGLRKLSSRVAMAVVPACRSEYHRQGWEGWERYSLYRREMAEQINGQFDPLPEPPQRSDRNLDPLNAALRFDQGTVLADRLLLKSDGATMAYGLEARAPLLDHQLADVAGRLPIELKTTSKMTKVALRTIAARLLPPEIVARRKKGFSMPLDSWLRNELSGWTRKCLVDESVALPRFFKRSSVERLLSEHAAGENHSGRIHTLLMFELWCRQYLG